MINMKKSILILFMCMVFSLVNAGTFSIEPVGEWRSHTFRHMVVDGNIAYCASGQKGVEIINCANQASLKRIAHIDVSGAVNHICKSGQYLYLLVDSNGLLVFNVNNPGTPTRVGWLYGFNGAGEIAAYGSELFVIDSDGLHVIDVTTPSTPAKKKTIPLSYAHQMSVNGNFLFLVARDNINSPEEFMIYNLNDPSGSFPTGRYSGITESVEYTVNGNNVYIFNWLKNFIVLNISNPSNPWVSSKSDKSYGSFPKPVVRGNYLYISTNGPTPDYNIATRIIVYNISNPAEPVLEYSSESDYGGCADAVLEGDTLYVLNEYSGLYVYSLTQPTAPVMLGSYKTVYGFGTLDIKGQYAFVSAGYSGVSLFDVSNTARLRRISQHDTPGIAQDAASDGRYAYVTYSGYGGDGMEIVDFSNPMSPKMLSNLEFDSFVKGVALKGNYAYVASWNLHVVDVSNPSAPQKLGVYPYSGRDGTVYVSGNYAYVTGKEYCTTKDCVEIISGSLTIFDVSNPRIPVKIGEVKTNDLAFASDVFVNQRYAYVAGGRNGLLIYDILDPTAPVKVGQYKFSGYILAGQVTVIENTAYVSVLHNGVYALDISNPAEPVLLTVYKHIDDASGLFAEGGIIYAAGRHEYENGTGEGVFLTLRPSETSGLPLALVVDPGELSFGMTRSGVTSKARTVRIDSPTGEEMQWYGGGPEWLTVSPTTGKTGEEIFVSVNPSGLAPGKYEERVTVNSPSTEKETEVFVYLTVYEDGHTSPPFGTFSTPVEDVVHSGSLAVTGWALDDVGIQGVKIYRMEGIHRVFIGDAVFVEGARPDVQAAYRDYPNSGAAGWGYMMLTNFLPNNGNGTYTLQAVATDMEGNEVLLGTRTITCNNAGSVLPFGALDTPLQGGTISGKEFYVFGWALTPVPNTIPTDGSKIRVWVDGVAIGQPVYNQYREDIATFFPGYNNSDGAVGYFVLDTEQYDNGLHTISWSVEDDAGNKDGIGSRFFRIQNNAGNYGRKKTGTQGTLRSYSNERLRVPGKTEGKRSPIQGAPWPSANLRLGFDTDAEPSPLRADETGTYTVVCEEMQPIEIRLPLNRLAGPGAVSELSPILTGISYDSKNGVFCWLPGPGFVGLYQFQVAVLNKNGEISYHQMNINIQPKGKNKDTFKNSMEEFDHETQKNRKESEYKQNYHFQPGKW